jgi:choline dehydrogenase
MKTQHEKEGLVYDYVVIGAGASGPIVANSLATDGYTVLLLEAGLGVDAEDKDVWDPQRWFKVQEDPVIEWGYKSIPQINLSNRSLSMQQSRCLGGCTVHNAMVYVRGGQTTYNHWEQELGCTGWGYESLEPLFEGLEKKIGILRGEPDDFVNAFFTAAQNSHFPYNENYNLNKTEYGAVPFQFAIEKDGKGLRRTTSYEKYIRTQNDLKGLTVEPGAFVHYILFAGENEKGEVQANGVRYQNSFGDLKNVYVNHEVILSAGTIASPKILLQSGVGPADELKELKITVIKDLPAVGKNFYDDLGIPSLFTQKQTLPPQPYGFITSGIFASDKKGFDPKNPGYGEVNMEMQVCSSDLPGAPGMGFGYYSVGMAAMHLKSRGSITLGSKDPREAPVIDPNYLSEEGDLARCIYAIKLSLKISWDEALNNWRCLPVLPTAFPISPIEWGWIGLQPTFDKYLEDYISNWALSIQHYIGTCTMGIDPKSSVVGPDLKVHGISGLRVIDASIAPTPVTGNTAGVSYMIGAKGAELLKKKS